MLRLPKKALFAIEAVLDIGYYAGVAPVQSKEITHRQGIPRRYLEQALQQLVRHGILVGVRGPRGGYRLARERQRITIGDIVRVVQGGGNRALETDGMEGSELGTKVVRPLWAEIHDRVMAQLDNLSIEDLRSEADKAGIVIESHNALDFTI
tara:strand:+ start:178 stop:633 length:456 start_codon:yes stop_codon:yes gene_type:complete